MSGAARRGTNCAVFRLLPKFNPTVGVCGYYASSVDMDTGYRVKSRRSNRSGDKRQQNKWR